MVTSADKSFIETRQIKLGNANMDERFVPLADWIEATYQVKPLNIIFDVVEDGKLPRLEICFEYKEDTQTFYTTYYNFDKNKQKAIIKKFNELVSGNADSYLNTVKRWLDLPYPADNLFVIYSAFAPIAMSAAHDSITNEELAQLKQKLNDPNLWHISRSFGVAAFFLYTDKQLKQYKESALRKEWTDSYFDLVKKYDEFDYIKRVQFEIYLDSKENFDNNYQSNWYYYYK